MDNEPGINNKRCIINEKKIDEKAEGRMFKHKGLMMNGELQTMKDKG